MVNLTKACALPGLRSCTARAIISSPAPVISIDRRRAASWRDHLDIVWTATQDIALVDDVYETKLSVDLGFLHILSTDVGLCLVSAACRTDQPSLLRL